MEGPIPENLPPITPITISYYRRNNQGLFKTRVSPES